MEPFAISEAIWSKVMTGFFRPSIIKVELKALHEGSNKMLITVQIIILNRLSIFNF